MRNEIIKSLGVAVLTILVCAIAYPLAILGAAAIIAPAARHGSLIVDSAGTVRGSSLIAQRFTQLKYFWSRPSACDFNASAAAGSNLSPANPAVREQAAKIIGQLGLADDQLVPADLVTASGGGLDPHISYAAAVLQAPRVATSRNLSENEVLALINRHTTAIPFANPQDGGLVHVLELNRELDEVAQAANE